MAHPKRMIPILDQLRIARIVDEHPDAVPVVKRGLVPLVQPKPGRLTELAAGREVVGVGYLNNKGVEKLIQGEPYAAAINPVLIGTGETASVAFNANGMADRPTLEKNYLPTAQTYEQAQTTGLSVQGDLATVNSVLEGRVVLNVRGADGEVVKVKLEPSDFTIAWHETNAGNVRHVMQIPQGFRAIFPKEGWGSVEVLEAPGVTVANGAKDGYRDEAGLDKRVSLLVRSTDSVSVPKLAEEGKIPTLSAADLKAMEFTARELRNLPETQPANQKTPVVTKALIKGKIDKMPEPDKEAVKNWLVSIGASRVAKQLGLKISTWNHLVAAKNITKRTLKAIVIEDRPRQVRAVATAQRHNTKG